MVRKKQPMPLREHVQTTIKQYLEDMGSTEPEHVYRKLLAEIEPPLIEEVLAYTRGNQSRAARILGMTRNTLRSKLRRYDLKCEKFPGLKR
jgi:Fis family transcriptional regulator